ncbi:ATP-binding protein [Reichenbachiella agarivorans]|uniref:histidine kinase n=1 Tax=Reichenbachiella agarivorans TaxID=2979464 RepID=A0ABY6CPL6_9BACT|nr:ATP-binding protein [Reichenbachiella agarivorans]UXP31975.1 ATP-binding protein [Reichenbachiella agarivorans]
MKKDNLIRSYVLTLILIIIGLFIGQFLVQSTIRVNKNDARLVKLAQRQATLSEDIAKNSLLMSTDRIQESDKNFTIVKRRLKKSIDEFTQIQNALTKGDRDLGINNVDNSDQIIALLTESEVFYKEVRDAALEIYNVAFEDSPEDKALIINRAIINISDQQKKFTDKANEIADRYEEEAYENKAGSSSMGYIITAIIIGVILLQASFVFRPAVNLAYKNFLTANEAFVKLQKSEEHLRRSAERQLEANERLILSQRALEQRNKKLKLSEQEILKSSRKQIEVNEKLIRVQEELRKAYDRVKYSEERMRNIAEEQLEATEKLMITENQLKMSLEHEKSSKNELTNTLNNLKSTQSQLVQSEKMASLGQLTAGIAHEINNPINFVYNGIDTLKVSLDDLMIIIKKYGELEDSEDYNAAIEEIKALKEEYGFEDLLEDVKELVADIKKGAVRTIEIVKGLRVFSRLDEEEMKPANMNESLDATLTLLRNKTKNIINVKKYYDEDIEEINCYPGQLNQVFMNIISNAIQAIPEERKDGEIQIYTENQDQHLMIKIKDNGAGMSEQVKRRIFEPFFTTKPVGIGTGLGMSITFGIIEKHGGNIYVNSEEGKGTEFSILIPKHLAEKKNQGKVSQSQQA